MGGVLRAGLERMLPRLQAQRELSLATAVAAGTGNLDKRDARRWVRDRERLVQGGSATRRARSWDEHFQMLRSAGIHVVIDDAPGEVVVE